ncbi:MAG TPA: thiamine pyrophosphate-requiring protein [Alphaproteobacteria bacterium]
MPSDIDNGTERYSASDALLAVLEKMGVTHIFGNLGSDHAGIIESIVRSASQGRQPFQLVLCPHEAVALTAAHGYAQVTGRPQAVFVHVDVGTLNMGGAITNAFHGRIPVFIFAGLTPYTLEGELPGSRNRAATYLQDVTDQGSLIRQYVKWDYSIRTGANVEQLVFRAMQIAQSQPMGPVYLTGAREVLEENAKPYAGRPDDWRPIEPSALTSEAVAEIIEALSAAKSPLLITSFSGVNAASVEELVKFCERLGIPVVEERPIRVNFPADHPLHLGYQAESFVADADVIVVLDCDVPWVAASSKKPSETCRVFYLDVDPLKEDLPLWYMPAERFYKVDSHTALKQLNAALDAEPPAADAKRSDRVSQASERHRKMRQKWADGRDCPSDDVITPGWIAACLSEVVDADAIVINESVTSTSAIFQRVPRTKPGTFFGSGGSSLGWGGGAALGTKMAAPDKLVVLLTGDGAFFLDNPSSVFWASRKYGAPFLTVVFNNQGWNATRENFQRIHAEGGAGMDVASCISLAPSANFADVAQAAGDAMALTVDQASQLPAAMKAAVEAVRNGRSAVIDARMKPLR